MSKFRKSGLDTLTRTLTDIDTEFRTFLNSLHIDDQRFFLVKTRALPKTVQKILQKEYARFNTSYAANTYLRETTDNIRAVLPAFLIEHFDSGEEELRQMALRFSESCRDICRYNVPICVAVQRQPDSSAECPGKLALALKNTRHAQVSTCEAPSEINAAYGLCKAFVESKGIHAPEVSSKQTIEGCIKRMQDKNWWLRKLRKVLKRKIEHVMILLNKVNRIKGKYSSDLTVENRRLQRIHQQNTLGAINIINEAGERFSLKDIYEVNISNPVLRRNELMTRMRGFENLSKEMGHIGVFVTLTCPSRFHNSYSRSGDRNPKWDGSTPYDGQQYLCHTWAKMRAELDRQDIRLYGMRIAEPQHDGTPHWHMMLFMPKDQQDAFKAIVNHYSFEVDGTEDGAAENRVKHVDIDPAKGSATGYIAKYVAKNIDGANLDEDIDGGSAVGIAQRVEAWASCWGIRQFQQIGGVSVTVWREMRRIRNLVDENPEFSEIHKAADSGDWATYTKLMGGVFCIRKSQKVRPYYETELNQETGELKQSWFDGELVKKLKGVAHLGREIITRVHRWRMEWAAPVHSPLLGVL